MNVGTRCSDLDAGTKRRIAMWCSILVAMRAVAHWDVHRRAADKIRGTKRLRTALLVTFFQVPPAAGENYGGKLLRTMLSVVSFGIPVAYVVLGRKPSPIWEDTDEGVLRSAYAR
jgi:hypothetical protein